MENTKWNNEKHVGIKVIKKRKCKKSKKVEKSCWQNQTIVIIYSSRLWDSKLFTTTTKNKSKKLLTRTTKYDIINKFAAKEQNEQNEQLKSKIIKTTDFKSSKIWTLITEQ